MDLPDLTNRELIGLLTVELAGLLEDFDLDPEEEPCSFFDQATGNDTKLTMAQLIAEGTSRAGITTRVVTEGGRMQ